MRTALVIAEFALVLLVVVVVVADRAGARFAERTASTYLAEALGRPPVVRVHGRPFLTQVVRGRYPDVEVSCAGLQIASIEGAVLRAHLYDVLLPPGDVIARRVTSLLCGRLDGLVLLPYRELARVSRVPGMSLNHDGERLVASMSVPLPGVSQLARASGRARLSVVGGVVWLRVRGLSVAGISLPSRMLEQLLPSVNVPIPLPTLPYGLRVDELTPVAAGLLVRALAENVVLMPVSDVGAETVDPGGL